MYELISVIVIIICVILILVVLIQNPKGGGLSSTFGGGGSQVMGVRRTTDFLEKATWYLAVALIVLSIGSATLIEERPDVTDEEAKTEMQEKAEDAPTNFPPVNPNTPLPGGQ